MKLWFVLLICLVLAACVKQPTRNTQVVDDRPGIAFKLTSHPAAGYELQVDGVSYGRVGQFQEGESVLKIIDGTHQVKLLSGDKVVYEKEVYLGAGSNRILRIGSYE